MVSPFTRTITILQVCPEHCEHYALCHTISVLVARGRAQVGVLESKSDWSKRIRNFQYMDYDDYAAHHW